MKIPYTIRPVALGACLLVMLFPARQTQAQINPNDLITSREKIGEAKPATGYRVKWALIVGVDYAKRDDLSLVDKQALPRLANASNDAAALAEKLIAKYGYDREHVVTLIEEDATRDRFLGELEKLHSDRVSSDDSVLVFFAGHGALQSQADGRVAIYPYDVRFEDGRPLERMIYVHDDVLSRLTKSKARHTLLILDSCHSGDIFNHSFQADASSDDRGGASHFTDRGLQVIASCRGWETASDGSGVNSPFTRALLTGLEQLPSLQPDEPRIWTNRLMNVLRDEFNGLPNGQRPSCRNLVGQGEFSFFPDFEHAKFGDPSDGQLLSIAMLQVTSPGVKGNWWFEEMPWFIPSIRSRLLIKNVAQRSNGLSAGINPSQLKTIAEGVASEMRAEVRKLEAVVTRTQAESDRTDPALEANLHLQKLRLEHLSALLNETDPAARLKTLVAIETDLSAEATLPLLDAADLHLLAVVQHALSRSETPLAYEAALDAYRWASESNDQEGNVNLALKALCHADYGDFLLDHRSKPRDAVDQFVKASTSIGLKKAPPAFRIYCLCRQATAFLQENRWKDANDKLEDAKKDVNEFDSKHYLAAFVHRSDAWSKMIQWRVREAELAFTRSNEILLPIITSRVDGAEDAATAYEVSPEDSPQFRKSSDFEAKVAYFHNLHGLAMALRYRGRPAEAVDGYRRVIALIEETLSSRRGISHQSTAETETNLLVRFVNSQERLGDCNLFSDPSMRDLAEAADDYRRALSRVHRLPSSGRDRLRAQLLYKQALSFSLPSAVQDIPFASEMCNEADILYADESTAANGLFLALRTLTPSIVHMMDTNKSHTGPGNATESASDTAAELRDAIHRLRDLAGPTPHRDQLELMMFATKLLLEQGRETSRFKRSEDIELLLSLTRLTLDRRPDQSPGVVNVSSQAFMRTYFDTAFLASVSTTPDNLKRLLEIRHEATTGTPYAKVALDRSEESVTPAKGPTLAVYALADQAYLIYDVPGQRGECVELSDICSTEELCQACQPNADRIRLPKRILDRMNGFSGIAVPHERVCDVQYHDPVMNPVPTSRVESDESSGTANDSNSVDANRFTKSQMPFILPSGWAVR